MEENLQKTLEQSEMHKENFILNEKENSEEIDGIILVKKSGNNSKETLHELTQEESKQKNFNLPAILNEDLFTENDVIQLIPEVELSQKELEILNNLEEELKIFKNNDETVENVETKENKEDKNKINEKSSLTDSKIISDESVFNENTEENMLSTTSNTSISDENTPKGSFVIILNIVF